MNVTKVCDVGVTLRFNDDSRCLLDQHRGALQYLSRAEFFDQKHRSFQPAFIKIATGKLIRFWQTVFFLDVKLL